MEKYLKSAPKRRVKRRWPEDFLLQHEEHEKSLYRYWLFKPYGWSLKKTCIPEDWIPIDYDICGLREEKINYDLTDHKIELYWAMEKDNAANMGTKRPKIETPQFALIEYDEKESGLPFGIVNVNDLASNNPLVPFKNYKVKGRSYYCLLWYINSYKECQRRLFAKKFTTSNISH